MFSKKSCLPLTFVFQVRLRENQGENGVFLKMKLHGWYVENI